MVTRGKCSLFKSSHLIPLYHILCRNTSKQYINPFLTHICSILSKPSTVHALLPSNRQLLLLNNELTTVFLATAASL